MDTQKRKRSRIRKQSGILTLTRAEKTRRGLSCQGEARMEVI